VAVVGALASPLAFAQNVTLYGGVDMGLQHADSGQTGAKNFVVSGQWYTSRFGLKASDDIGDGLYSLLQLEHGINVDTGDQADPTFWTRTAMVGLGNKAWGELTFGQQYTHMFNMANQLLPTTFAGSIPPAGAQVRAHNDVKFSSANFSGVTFGAEWSPQAAGGALANPDPSAQENLNVSNAGRYWDAHVGYSMKPFSVDFAHGNLKSGDGSTAAGATITETKRNQLVGMWDSGAFGVFAGWANDKSTAAGSPELRHIWVQPVARFGGANEVYGLWGQTKLKSSSNKSTYLGVAYRRLLSKRTFVYAQWGQRKDDSGGAGLSMFDYQAGSPVNGKDKQQGLGVGVVLTF